MKWSMKYIQINNFSHIFKFTVIPGSLFGYNSMKQKKNHFNLFKSDVFFTCFFFAIKNAAWGDVNICEVSFWFEALKHFKITNCKSRKFHFNDFFLLIWLLKEWQVLRVARPHVFFGTQHSICFTFRLKSDIKFKMFQRD